jgi:hypothetical protein
MYLGKLYRVMVLNENTVNSSTKVGLVVLNENPKQCE